MQAKQNRTLAPYIDHTLLKPETNAVDIARLCLEASRHQFKAVCVNPVFVKIAREHLSSTNVAVAAVVGFPLGATTTATKAFETERAVAEGASEIDMVMRIDLALGGDANGLERDIRGVVEAAQRSDANAIVKVIFETGLLNREAIQLACRASENAGASFVKTATGFLGRGASTEDIQLMRASCGAKMQIKASGGIKTAEQAWQLIELGATRIGTSSGVALVTGAAAGAEY